MYHHKSGIVLRKVERFHLPVLLHLKNQSWAGTHRTLIANLDDQENWYEALPNDSLFMIGEADGEMVGVCCYTQIDHVGRVCAISGSALSEMTKFAKAGWACGLDFAFEILNMYRVEAEVLTCNYVGQQLNIRYLEMRVEGCRRQAVYKAGRYYDSLLLGLLRDEWEQSERVKGYNGTCNLDFDHDLSAKFIARSEREIIHASQN